AIRRQRGVVEAREDHAFRQRVRSRCRAHLAHRDRRGRVERIAIDTATDRREGDRAHAVLARELERAPVAAREERRLAGGAAAPDGPDRVDHEARRQAEAWCDLRVADRAAAQLAAGVEERGSRRPVDGAVDTAAAQQRRIGGVDDRVDGERGDVGLAGFEDGHRAQWRRWKRRLIAVEGVETPVYSSSMATPAPGIKPAPPARDPAAGGDRRLRIEDILKLMVADGLIPVAEADKLARVRTRQYEHPLELIAAQKLKAVRDPQPSMTLEWLVEWLAGKLGVRYWHIDPLKIDLKSITGTMSNAYAERYRILPVELKGSVLKVATGEPFVRAWADELEKILKVSIELVFANPADVRRYLGEFFNLARSMKKAEAAQKGDVSLARDFEQLVELGRHGHLDANDQHVVHIVDWLWQYAFDQRASDIHLEPRRDVGQVRFRIDGVLHQVYTIPVPVLVAMTSRIKLLARMEIVERRRPQDGRVKTVSPSGQEIELRIATM